MNTSGFMDHVGQKIKFIPIRSSRPEILQGKDNTLLIPNSYTYKNTENYIPPNLIEKTKDEVENGSMSKFADYQMTKEESRIDAFTIRRPKSLTEDSKKILLS